MQDKSQDNLEDRDQQILRRITNIEYKLDSLGQTNAFTLRADADRHFETVKKIFGKSKRRAQVYLAADGEKSVQQIADHLSMKQANVSRELKNLKDEGLLGIQEKAGGETYWGKQPIDRTIRISQYLQKEFDLTPSGLIN